MRKLRIIIAICLLALLTAGCGKTEEMADAREDVMNALAENEIIAETASETRHGQYLRKK